MDPVAPGRSRQLAKDTTLNCTNVKDNLSVGVDLLVGRRVLLVGQSVLPGPDQMRGLVPRGKLTQLSPVSRPSAAFELSERSGKRCLHALRRHGKLAQSAPGRVSESICQRRRCGRKRTFAGTERRIAALHQNNFNTGYLGKRQYGIARPVPARDLPLIEGNLLLQTETDGLDDASRADSSLRPD